MPLGRRGALNPAWSALTVGELMGEFGEGAKANLGDTEGWVLGVLYEESGCIHIEEPPLGVETGCPEAYCIGSTARVVGTYTGLDPACMKLLAPAVS